MWRFWPLAVIAVAAGIVLASGVTRYLSFEQLIASRDSLFGFVESHFLAALAIYALAYLLLAMLALPGGALLSMTGGFLFGAMVCTGITVVTGTLGASLLFLAARSSIGEVLRVRAGPWLNRFRQGFAQDAASYLLFLRLVPLFPFWLVNLAPAVLGANFGTFLWTTFFGIIPGTFAYTLAGSGLDSVLMAQKQAYQACITSGAAGCKVHIYPGQLVTRELLLAFAAMGVMALLPAGMKRWRRRLAARRARGEVTKA